MIIWLVALGGFLTISSVSSIVHILFLVEPATVWLFILGSLGAIMIDQCAECSTDCKMQITVPECILEGADCRAPGIRGCVPHLRKYQDFCCISYILKELYCISDASLDVLKINVIYYGGL